MATSNPVCSYRAAALARLQPSSQPIRLVGRHDTPFPQRLSAFLSARDHIHSSLRAQKDTTKLILQLYILWTWFPWRPVEQRLTSGPSAGWRAPIGPERPPGWSRILLSGSRWPLKEIHTPHSQFTSWRISIYFVVWCDSFLCLLLFYRSPDSKPEKNKSEIRNKCLFSLNLFVVMLCIASFTSIHLMPLLGS